MFILSHHIQGNPPGCHTPPPCHPDRPVFSFCFLSFPSVSFARPMGGHQGGGLAGSRACPDPDWRIAEGSLEGATGYQGIARVGRSAGVACL